MNGLSQQSVGARSTTSAESAVYVLTGSSGYGSTELATQRCRDPTSKEAASTAADCSLIVISSDSDVSMDGISQMESHNGTDDVRHDTIVSPLVPLHPRLNIHNSQSKRYESILNETLTTLPKDNVSNNELSQTSNTSSLSSSQSSSLSTSSSSLSSSLQSDLGLLKATPVADKTDSSIELLDIIHTRKSPCKIMQDADVLMDDLNRFIGGNTTLSPIKPSEPTTMYTELGVSALDVVADAIPNTHDTDSSISNANDSDTASNSDAESNSDVESFLNRIRKQYNIPGSDKISRTTSTLSRGPVIESQSIRSSPDRSFSRFNSEPTLSTTRRAREEDDLLGDSIMQNVGTNTTKRRRTKEQSAALRAESERLQSLRKVNKIQHTADTMKEMTVSLPRNLFGDIPTESNRDISSNTTLLSQQSAAPAAEQYEVSQPMTASQNITSTPATRMKLSMLSGRLKEKGCSLSFRTNSNEGTFDIQDIFQFDYESRAIRFIRTTKREWDENENMWKPLTNDNTRVFFEHVVVYYFTATEIARISSVQEARFREEIPQLNNTSSSSQLQRYESSLVESERHEGIQSLFGKLMSNTKNRGCRVILLIEGLALYSKRYATAERYARDNDIQQQIASRLAENSEPQTTSTSRRDRNKNNNNLDILSLPDPIVLSEALVSLQVHSNGKLLIHESKNEHNTVEWLETFVEQISKMDELRHSGAEAESLPFADHVTSGKTYSDTWMRILREIHLCSDTKARSIVKAYPTIKALFDALKICNTEQERIKVIAEIPLLDPNELAMLDISNSQQMNSEADDVETMSQPLPVEHGSLDDNSQQLLSGRNGARHWSERNVGWQGSLARGGRFRGRYRGRGGLSRANTTGDVVTTRVSNNNSVMSELSQPLPTVTSTKRRQKNVGVAVAKNVLKVMLETDPAMIAVKK